MVRAELASREISTSSAKLFDVTSGGCKYLRVPASLRVRKYHGHIASLDEAAPLPAGFAN
jgi:hypothetical protein